MASSSLAYACVTLERVAVLESKAAASTARTCLEVKRGTTSLGCRVEII